VNKKISVKYILIASGVFFSGVTATHAELHSADSITMQPASKPCTLTAITSYLLFIAKKSVLPLKVPASVIRLSVIVMSAVTTAGYPAIPSFLAGHNAM